jgi:cell division protein FtsA
MDTNNIYVALNIGSSEITAMAVQKNEEGQLRILGVETGNSEGVRYGEIINPSSASAVVNRLLKLLENRIGRDIGQIYVGLNGRSLKTLKASNGRQLNSGAEVTDVLLYEMISEVKDAKTEQGAIYEVYMQETKVDDEIEPSPIGCLCEKIVANYRVILGKPELKTNIERCIERTGYGLINTPIQTVTTADALLTNIEKEQGCVLVDFGAHCTSLAIFHHGYLRYLSVIPLGGKNITKDITSLELPENIAEQIKIQFANAIRSTVNPSQRITIKSEIPGMEPKRIPLQTLAMVTEARAGEILDLIFVHIQKSGLAGHLGAGIIITGNASKLQNLDALIQQKTQLPVRLGTHNLHLEDGTNERYYDIRYSPLIGLLLSADMDCAYQEEEKVVESGKQEKPQKPPKPPKIKRNNVFNKIGGKVANSLINLFSEEEESSNENKN